MSRNAEFKQPETVRARTASIGSALSWVSMAWEAWEAEGDIVNCKSVPGKIGSFAVSSYSSHSMMAIHYVPLSPLVFLRSYGDRRPPTPSNTPIGPRVRAGVPAPDAGHGRTQSRPILATPDHCAKLETGGETKA